MFKLKESDELFFSKAIAIEESKKGKEVFVSDYSIPSAKWGEWRKFTHTRNKHTYEEYVKVRKLRRRGLTILTIANKLKYPLSKVKYLYNVKRCAKFEKRYCKEKGE